MNSNSDSNQASKNRSADSHHVFKYTLFCPVCQCASKFREYEIRIVDGQNLGEPILYWVCETCKSHFKV